MLWVYGHYRYFNSVSAGIVSDVYKRQILASKDGPRAYVRVYVNVIYCDYLNTD